MLSTHSITRTYAVIANTVNSWENTLPDFDHIDTNIPVCISAYVRVFKKKLNSAEVVVWNFLFLQS